jgi:hypothetical protein
LEDDCSVATTTIKPRSRLPSLGACFFSYTR